MTNMELNENSPLSDEELENMRHELEYMPRNRLMHVVLKGILGMNQGLSNGLTTLNKYLHGTHPGTYYLIGADSGVGKTTLANYMFLYSLYMACKELGIRLEIDYYNLEMGDMMLKLKLSALHYFLKFNKMISVEQIMGRPDKRSLSREELANYRKVEAEIEEIHGSIWWCSATTPSEMWRRIVVRAARSGEVIRESSEPGAPIIGYKPKTDRLMRVTMIDHIALMDTERGLNTKQTIDLASQYLVRARNLFEDTCVVVQQFTTDMQNSARETRKAIAYVPTRQDFGDSKYTFRDADVVLGLIRPWDFRLDKFGYFTRLQDWGDYFTLIYLMKHRFGAGGRTVPLFINPIAGIPTELPGQDQWSHSLEDSYIKAAQTLDKWQ